MVKCWLFVFLNLSYELDENEELDCPITFTDGDEDIPHYSEGMFIIHIAEVFVLLHLQS